MLVRVGDFEHRLLGDRIDQLIRPSADIAASPPEVWNINVRKRTEFQPTPYQITGKKAVLLSRWRNICRPAEGRSLGHAVCYLLGLVPGG